MVCKNCTKLEATEINVAVAQKRKNGLVLLVVVKLSLGNSVASIIGRKNQNKNKRHVTSIYVVSLLCDCRVVMAH